MSDPPSKTHNINGHLWRDVTNETTPGAVYSLRDVVRAGGRIPTTVSTEGDRMQDDGK